jgi:hypothetical protein
VGLKFLNMIALFFFMFIFVALISWAWASGIDNMKKNHPDYEGEDFLNWDKMKRYEDDLYK